MSDQRNSEPTWLAEALYRLALGFVALFEQKYGVKKRRVTLIDLTE